MNRRTFILAAGAGIAAVRAAGANDRVNMAVIGLRGRGRTHVDIFGSLPDSTVAAVVDIDDSMSERAVAQAVKVQKSQPKSYRDLRQMLEDKNIDAVSIATCNHWHALATIWACQAGKDVYVEKPLAHNVKEGRAMVDAARKYDRVVAVGTQQRSSENFRKAVEVVRSEAERHLGRLFAEHDPVSFDVVEVVEHDPP